MPVSLREFEANIIPISPRRKSLPRVHRFSRQEVYKLCDEGWFADQRVNLIRGRIIVAPLPGP